MASVVYGPKKIMLIDYFPRSQSQQEWITNLFIFQLQLAKAQMYVKQHQPKTTRLKMLEKKISTLLHLGKLEYQKQLFGKFYRIV
jgi:hypothetical protein